MWSSVEMLNVWGSVEMLNVWGSVEMLNVRGSVDMLNANEFYYENYTSTLPHRNTGIVRTLYGCWRL